jgi:hypothetical protein
MILHFIKEIFFLHDLPVLTFLGELIEIKMRLLLFLKNEVSIQIMIVINGGKKQLYYFINVSHFKINKS